MFFGIADNTNPTSLAARMRRRRMQLFTQLLEPFPEPVSLLDVGGTAGFWEMYLPELPKRVHLTLLNLTATPTGQLPDTVSIAGDARRMSDFADRAFQVCFSNSVIEHVGTFADQRAMALEIQRVSHAYFVQTPNHFFPIEPHFLFPGWQFLPRYFKTLLHQKFNLGWMARQPDRRLAQAEVEQIRLLNLADMKRLFPSAEIHREKFGPLVKSLIAVRQAPK